MRTGMESTMILLIGFSLMLCEVKSVNPAEGLVNRLMTQREALIQDGLSYFNSSSRHPSPTSTISLDSVRNVSNGHQVRCILNVENWTRWLLGYQVFYFKHGTFQKGFHDREVFPSHREIIITGNKRDVSFTGTSGVIAWELEDQNVHLIVMWSIPYNLGIYNSYLAIGVVKLTTTVSRDMLPYYYKEMIDHEQGRVFQRGKPGSNILFRHENFFVVANLEEGYQAMLNVSVMPWSTKDLAPSIWHKLYLESLKPEMKSEAYSSSCDRFLHTSTQILAGVFIYKLS
ncbi:tereporin-Ca1 [Eurytemora carolleeae]|uniref:tereporin-Ca1 n=1 Tax=Eurytemora carolleeae TaxID=1294199 RepID=UPI000C784B3C|nr:tereporin-Ca1 [Eurytemora carolleeae]|eukprot:XP_023328862.1 tereporin-Ca1-like [Eurytemora affinis]